MPVITAAWEWMDRPGLEHLTLGIGPDSIVAQGLVVVGLDDIVTRVRYEVRCDDAWGFRNATVELGQPGVQQYLALVLGDDGSWTANGEPRPDLARCTTIDLMATPFTNTLPLRTLRLAPEQPSAFTAAFIRFPGLTVTPVDQEYTKLDTGEPARRFRYRNLVSGYTADLTVDAERIVLDYPGSWRRIGES